jgi:hypothetical protein
MFLAPEGLIGHEVIDAVLTVLTLGLRMIQFTAGTEALFQGLLYGSLVVTGSRLARIHRPSGFPGAGLAAPFCVLVVLDCNANRLGILQFPGVAHG